jgi:MFS family permease
LIEPGAADVSSLRLGLGANRGQFALLVLVNAFVGAMVGQERAVLPLVAEREFGVSGATALLAFVASFGFVKALANLAAGHYSERFGRRRLLIAGWLVGLAVPPLLMFAPAWGWIVFANVLLGVNQGLCWSTTVIMKIDLVGPKRRGLAMGLNEFSGYLAVAGAALLAGWIASTAPAMRPAAFVPGVAFALAGLLLSVFAVRETRGHAALEASGTAGDAAPKGLAEVLLLTSWKDRTLFGISQAGLVNNLNDGVVWGLVPVLLARSGLDIAAIAQVAALYPAVWGVGQLATGPLSDRIGRRLPIAGGMLVQSCGIALFAITPGYVTAMLAATLLGLGTALVYPTLLAAVSDIAHPAWRAQAVGVYRLWRDGGYVVGALGAGLLADAVGMPAAIGAVAVVTLLSGGLAALVMRESRPVVVTVRSREAAR